MNWIRISFNDWSLASLFSIEYLISLIDILILWFWFLDLFVSLFDGFWIYTNTHLPNIFSINHFLSLLFFLFLIFTIHDFSLWTYFFFLFFNNFTFIRKLLISLLKHWFIIVKMLWHRRYCNFSRKCRFAYCLNERNGLFTL